MEEAVARYHSNAVSTVEMIQELTALAEETRAFAERGEAQGSAEAEIAFGDALVENDYTARTLPPRDQAFIVTYPTMRWHAPDVQRQKPLRSKVMSLIPLPCLAVGAERGARRAGH